MRRSVLACLASVVLLAGCGERPEPVAPELTPFPASARDADGETRVVEERPTRIAALTPAAAELVRTLGAGDRLVAGPAGLAEREVVRPSGFVDLAELAAAEPDLVVAGTETDRETLDVAARRTLAPVYVAPDRSVRDAVRAALGVGLLVGEPVRGREVARALRRQIGDVERRVAPLQPVRAFVDTGFLVTVGDGSFLADLVRRAGGVPVATDDAGAPVEPCRLVRLQTEVVLRLADATTGRQRRPRFAACRGTPPRTVELRAELVARPGPRTGDALEAVARALHPDAFR